MSNPLKKRDDDATGGGIVGAVTQDIELTAEQAEAALKKAAHAAAVKLGIAHSEEPSEKADSATPSAEEPAETAPPPSSKSEPKA